MSTKDASTPKKKKHYIQLPDSTEKHFVDDEIYHAYYDLQNQLLSKMRKIKQCVCPVKSWYKCKFDCFSCQYYRRREISLDDDNSPKLADPGSLSPEDEYLRMEMLRRLYDALYALAPLDRLIMCYLMEGYSQREIARKLETPWSTFRAHFQRILRQFTTHFEKLV